MKVLLLTNYWPPEYGPDQAILFENMSYLRDHGVEVTVIAALPSYPTGIVAPEYRNRLLVAEEIGGMRTIRTWTYSGDRRKLKKRIANEVSFAASCFLALGIVRQRFDVVLTLTPPQETTLSGWLMSKLVRARYVLYVMDLMPEAAISLGMIENRTAIAALRALADFCYRRSAAIVASSEQFKRGVEAYGIPAERVMCVPNGIDTELFRPGDPDPSLRATLGLGSRFVAIYAGTHAYAHDLDSIVEVAARLQTEGDDSIAFVLVGGGSDKARVQQRAAAAGLRNVHFLDPVERERVPALLAAADVVLVTFRRLEVNRGVIPTKMYDAMACGRPLILGIEGEARDILVKSGGGIAIEPENPDRLLEALRHLQRDPAQAQELGAKARRYVEETYSREHCAELLYSVLRRVATT
jgi:colanic acid biosynthesis glycosyl transferase WcaI